MKYGLRSVLRTPVKSILFLLLTAVVTMFLAVGCGMWNAANHMLEDADAHFMTAGEFLYEGTDGTPAENQLTEEMLAGREVLMMEESITQRAWLDGYVLGRKSMPYGKHVVLTVNVMRFEEYYGAWLALVEDCRYSEKDVMNTYVFFPKEDVPELEKGRYVISGRFVKLKRGEGYVMDRADYLGICPLTESELKKDFNVENTDSLIALSEYESPEDFWESEQGRTYEKIADTLNVRNHSVDVVATQCLEAVAAFHTGAYTIMEGSYFTEKDYQNGNVCVIPNTIAKMFELQVGDSLPLGVAAQKQDVKSCDSYFSGDGFAYEGDFKVVGIYQAEERVTPIFLPDAGQEWLAHGNTDATLARVILDNRSAQNYIDRIEEELPEGVHFYASDQGYAASVVAINSMLRSSLLLVGVCAVLGILILSIFSYMYLASCRETVRILWTLGTTRRGIIRMILAGSGGITGAASVLGSVSGAIVSKNLIGKIYGYIEAAQERDLRFSIRGYGVAGEDFVTSPRVEFYIFALLAAAVFLIAQLFCGILLRNMLKSYQAGVSGRCGKQAGGLQNRKAVVDSEATEETASVTDERQAARRRKKTVGSKGLFILKVPCVSLRYALRCILRGGSRNMVIPVLFASLIIALSGFGAVRQGLDRRLASVYDDVPVTLVFTDVTGRKLNDLVIRPEQITEMEETGFVDRLWYGSSYDMQFIQKVNPPERYQYVSVPLESFAREDFVSSWYQTSKPLVVTEDINSSPEFFRSSEVEVTWAEGLGWDDYYTSKDIFTYENYCIVPQSFLQNNECELGDIVLLAFPYTFDFWSLEHVVVTIAGYYADRSLNSPVYITPDTLKSTSLFYISDDTEDEEKLWTYDYGGCELKNKERLGELRDKLAETYEQVGQWKDARRWVMIDDASLYDTIDNLTRYRNFMTLLYPVMLLLILGIGFVVSLLSVRGRKSEMAVLQGMGVGKTGIFTNLYLETILLAIPGIVSGALATGWIVGGWSADIGFQILMVSVCFLAGEALAIVQTLRGTLIYSLKQKED